MSDSLIVGLIISVFVIIVGLITVSYFRRRSMRWEGVVMDKGYTETVRTNSGSRHDNRATGSTISIGGISLGAPKQQYVSVNYYLVIQTTEGKELKWTISEGLYQIIKIGDRLTKEPGTLIPRVSGQSPVVS